MWQVNEKEWRVDTNRTKTLDYLVKQINSGHVLFPILPETKVIRDHLQGMVRLDRGDGDDSDPYWGKRGDDHYFHALNYLNVAANVLMEEYNLGGGQYIPPPGVLGVEVGKESTHNVLDGYKLSY